MWVKSWNSKSRFAGVLGVPYMAFVRIIGGRVRPTTKGLIVGSWSVSSIRTSSEVARNRRRWTGRAMRKVESAFVAMKAHILQVLASRCPRTMNKEFWGANAYAP